MFDQSIWVNLHQLIIALFSLLCYRTNHSSGNIEKCKFATRWSINLRPLLYKKKFFSNATERHYYLVWISVFKHCLQYQSVSYCHGYHIPARSVFLINFKAKRSSHFNLTSKWQAPWALIYHLAVFILWILINHAQKIWWLKLLGEYRYNLFLLWKSVHYHTKMLPVYKRFIVSR